MASALTAPVDIGSAVGGTGAGATVTTTADVPAGYGVAVFIGAATTTATVSSVVDSWGNTYVASGNSPIRGSNRSGWIYVCAATAKRLPVGSTITVTLSAGAAKAVRAVSLYGVKSSGAADKAVAGASATSTSPSSNSSGTLAQADELELGLIVTDGVTGDTFTIGGGFTLAGGSVFNSSVSNVGLYPAYKIVAATTGDTYSATITSRAWASILATYRAGATPETIRVAAVDVEADITGTTTGLAGVVVEADATGLTSSVAAVIAEADVTIQVTRSVAATASFLATPSRTIPATAALFSSAGNRAVPATVALSAAGLIRTVPATAALRAVFARTVGASASFKATSQRSVAATVAMQAALGRTIAATVRLQATEQKTIPASAEFEVVSAGPVERTVPAEAIFTVRATRTVPASAAFLVTRTRTIPIRRAFPQGERPIGASVSLAVVGQRTTPLVSVARATSTRVVPATVSLHYAGPRLVPTTGALLARATRTIAPISVPTEVARARRVVGLSVPTRTPPSLTRRTLPVRTIVGARLGAVRGIPATAALTLRRTRPVPVSAVLSGRGAVVPASVLFVRPGTTGGTPPTTSRPGTRVLPLRVPAADVKPGLHVTDFNVTVFTRPKAPVGGTASTLQTGVNVQRITHYGYGDIVPYATSGQIDSDLAAIKAMGMTLARVFVANPMVSDATSAARLKTFLDKAGAAGIKVIASLMDFYPSGSTIQGMDDLYGGTLSPSFFDGTYARYMEHLNTVVGVCKGHTALYAWEPGNELKNDADPDAFIAFMAAASARLKALDPSKPVATGMIRAGHTNLTPEALYPNLPNVDIICVHAYNGDRGGVPDIAWAVAHGKRAFIEEFGYPGTGDRSASVSAELTYWQSQKANAVLQWGFLASGLPDNGDGDNNVGMDTVWHTADYEALAALYRRTYTAGLVATEVSVTQFVIEVIKSRPSPNTYGQAHG